MNDDTPAFLKRLALGLDADVRAIRRAYARELKLIDQQNDLSGFQLLRHHYEHALAWAASQQGAAQESAPEQLAEQADAVPLTTPVALAKGLAGGPTTSPLADPHALAEFVFERFVLAANALVDAGHLDHVPPWEEALRLSMNDAELINITARGVFEARVVALLCGQWTRSLGPLLGAAAAVFDWEGDRRRLQQFGNAGAYLDRVIEERGIFRAQDEGELFTQRNVMARLRRDAELTPAQLRSDMHVLERMIVRFPSLMGMMVSELLVQKWRDNYKSLLKGRPAPMPDPWPETAADNRVKSLSNKAWIIFLVVVVLQIVRMMSQPDSQPPSPSSRYNTLPGASSSQAELLPEAAINGALAKVWLTADEAYFGINADIQYRPGRDVPPGELMVSFNVLAEPSGRIYGVNIVQRSGDVAFDRAVEAAIMRSRPLASALGTELHMQFVYTVSK